MNRQPAGSSWSSWGSSSDSKQTSFRYQILSADGSQVLLGNLEGDSGLEALVSQVYYLRLTASGAGQMALESEMLPEFSVVEGDGALIYSTPAAVAKEDSVVLRCGVLKPDRMEVQDEFSRLEQEFARCRDKFAFYLTLALSFAAAGPRLLTFLLWASGPADGGRKAAALPWAAIGSLLEVWVLLLVGGTALLLGAADRCWSHWFWAVYGRTTGSWTRCVSPGPRPLQAGRCWRPCFFGRSQFGCGSGPWPGPPCCAGW